MVGNAVKWLINIVVVILAAVTFFLVPLGKKTLFQHLKAVLTTPEASELGREVERTGQRVVDEVKDLGEKPQKPQKPQKREEPARDAGPPSRK